MNDANVFHRPAMPPPIRHLLSSSSFPTDVLVCYPGKKEITFSLRTKDYRTAVERHRAEEARLTSEWEENDSGRRSATRVRNSLPLPTSTHSPRSHRRHLSACRVGQPGWR
jgi:hypothetical protein